MRLFSDFFKGRIFPSLFLFFAALLIYLPLIGYGFLHFDDQKYITENQHVLSGLTWDSLKWAFFSPGVDNWIPLTWLSHMLDVRLFGLHAGLHHVVNIVFHALNTIILFIVFDRMTGRRIFSWAIAFIFAFHPMHVESVAWISERKDVLSTFYIFLSIFTYTSYVQIKKQADNSKSSSAFIFCLLFFVLSLLAKPMYVTFPLLLLVFDFWPLQRLLTLKDFKQCSAEKWTFFIFSAAIALATIKVQKHVGAVFNSTEFPLGYRLITSLMSASSYVQKFFYPEKLSIFYPAFSAHEFKAWGSSTLLVISGVTMFIVISFRKRAQWALAGWFLFLISLLPVLGFIKAGSQSIADRYTYFAYIGLSVLLLWSGEAWIRKRPFLKTPLIGALILWLIFCVLRTSNRIQDWQSTEKLFQSAVQLHPNNYVALRVLADNAYHQGDLHKAASYLEETLRVLPIEAESIRLEYELNLAIVYQRSEHFDLAAQAYEKLTQRLPLRADLMIALGDIYMKLNRPAQSRLQYEKALPLLPVNRELQEKLSRSKAL